MVKLDTLSKAYEYSPSTSDLGFIGDIMSFRYGEEGRWYRWDKPPSGWCKLYVNGSARDEKTLGGGIIRNHDGSIIVGFANFFGDDTNNLAELLALLDG